MSHRNGVVSSALLLLFLHPRSAAQTDGSGAQTADAAVSPPPVFSLGEELNPTMAVVMIVLVGAFFSLGFFSVYIRQCAQRRLRGGGATEAAVIFGGARRPWRTVFGVGDDVIRSLPSFRFKSVEIGKGSLECAVCLNEFEDDETLRLLPKCGHVFHSDCVGAWLSTHTTCPICRSNLVPKPGEDRSFTPVQVFEPEMNSNVQNPESNSRSIEENVTIQDKLGSTSPTAMRIGRLYPRSHSTGHSLAQIGERCDRFVPMLLGDVRIEISNSTLKRSRSLGALVVET